MSGFAWGLTFSYGGAFSSSSAYGGHYFGGVDQVTSFGCYGCGSRGDFSTNFDHYPDPEPGMTDPLIAIVLAVPVGRAVGLVGKAIGRVFGPKAIASLPTRVWTHKMICVFCEA
jgi:hypothetical protein